VEPNSQARRESSAHSKAKFLSGHKKTNQFGRRRRCGQLGSVPQAADRYGNVAPSGNSGPCWSTLHGKTATEARHCTNRKKGRVRRREITARGGALRGLRQLPQWRFAVSAGLEATAPACGVFWTLKARLFAGESVHKEPRKHAGRKVRAIGPGSPRPVPKVACHGTGGQSAGGGQGFHRGPVLYIIPPTFAFFLATGAAQGARPPTRFSFHSCPGDSPTRVAPLFFTGPVRMAGRR